MDYMQCNHTQLRILLSVAYLPALFNIKKLKKKRNSLCLKLLLYIEWTKRSYPQDLLQLSEFYFIFDNVESLSGK
jgi:hypothetical protein